MNDEYVSVSDPVHSPDPPPLANVPHPARAGASSKPSRSQAHTRWLACRRHLLGGPDASTASAAAAQAAAVLRADEPKSSPNALGAAPGRPLRQASAGSAGLWSDRSPAARASRRGRARAREIRTPSRRDAVSPGSIPRVMRRASFNRVSWRWDDIFIGGARRIGAPVWGGGAADDVEDGSRAEM